ncbi:hypothetical protein [Legionella spiritensis]|nr:hypothetical protein [Legionella spiritensis]
MPQDDTHVCSKKKINNYFLIALIFIIVISLCFYIYFKNLNVLLTTSCPSVTEVQTVIIKNSMIPGNSKYWRDINGFKWKIEIPETVKNPPIVSGFYMAYSQNILSLRCAYKVYKSSNKYDAIIASGQFNTNNPIKIPMTKPWITSAQGFDKFCQKNPQDCTFKLLKSSPSTH